MFRFILDDLTRVDEQALRARPLTAPARITLLLLKIAAGNPRLADDLSGWAEDLRARSWTDPAAWTSSSPC